jgi:hypothetical protein
MIWLAASEASYDFAKNVVVTDDTPMKAALGFP